MDLAKNHFSGIVYTCRTKKMGVSPTTTTGITSPNTSKVLKLKKVPPPTQDLLIDNSATSGVMPDSCGWAGVVGGGDVGGEGSQPSGNDEVAVVISRVEDRVRIRLTGSAPIVEIKNLKSRLEGELDLVRSFVKKVEAKEKLPSLFLVHASDKICSSPLVRTPSVAAIANDNPAVIGGVVERGERIRKENKCYNNSEFLLEKDRLPYERPYGSSKKSKNNIKEKKPSVSPQVSGIPVQKKPWVKDLKNKREMKNEEKQKLTEDIENFPLENPPPFVRIALKRGIEKIDTETFWALERFVRNYNKSSEMKAEIVQNAPIKSSGSMVAAALKASGTGVVLDVCCGAGVVDGGYGGGGGSSHSWNDEVATVILANDNPAVIGGVVERGKKIRKENKYYNNFEFFLAKDRLPYERPYVKSKKLNNKKEKKPSVSPQVSGIPVLRKPGAKNLKNKRELMNAEVAQNATITSSGSLIAATLKASGTGEMHSSASSTHVDNSKSCSSD